MPNRIEELKIFISHKGHDYEIAETLVQEFKNWGIHGKNIYCSSSKSANNVSPGKDLDADLRENILNSNLFIYLFTFKSHDWTICIKEYGIAEAQQAIFPDEEIKKVIFQCKNGQPDVGGITYRIKLDKTDIHNFVKSVHTTKGFIPKISSSDALFPEVDNDTILSRADSLYNKMYEIVPKGNQKSYHIVAFLRLSLSSESHAKIKEMISDSDKEKALEEIKNSLAVLKPSKPYQDTEYDSGYNVLSEFGYLSYEENLLLNDLAERWKEALEEEEAPWLTNLIETIYSSMSNRPIPEISSMFKTAKKDANWHYIPTITRARYKYDNTVEFDCYLIQVAENLL